MTIDRIFAVLPVADLAIAEPWYEKLFGRPADRVPMPSLREWHEGSAGFQVLEAPDRAGKAYATILVASLDTLRAQLQGRGLTLGPRQDGDVAGIAQIDDPAGNTITFAQRGAAATVEAGSIEAIVRAQFEAFRDRRRDDSQALLAPDFTFTSPYDDAISRDAFFERCWPPGDQFVDFRIERVTPDADGAYVTYCATTDGGTEFRNTEYLTVSGDQIHSATVYFGASYRSGAFLPQKAEG